MLSRYHDGTDTAFIVGHDMLIPTILRTPRLHWRPLAVSDGAAIYRQFSDAVMCRYFSEPPCRYADAQDIITHYRTRMGRVMRWVMHDEATGHFVGTCGYHYLNESQRHVEIGYDIWRDYWGQGYMREVLPRLLEVCVTHLPVDTVYALIHRDNAASIQVVRRAGFVATPPLRTPDTADECCWVYHFTQP